MARHRNIKRDEERTDINISPMIDMVFILLIFFIVTTVFVEEQGLETDKPQPGVSSGENKVPIKIRLASTGQVRINSGSDNAFIDISVSAVRSQVAERLRDQADSSVIIEAEKDVPAGRLIQVIDEAMTGGATKPSVTNAS